MQPLDPPPLPKCSLLAILHLGNELWNEVRPLWWTNRSANEGNWGWCKNSRHSIRVCQQVVWPCYPLQFARQREFYANYAAVIQRFCTGCPSSRQTAPQWMANLMLFIVGSCNQEVIIPDWNLILWTHSGQVLNQQLRSCKCYCRSKASCSNCNWKSVSTRCVSPCWALRWLEENNSSTVVWRALEVLFGSTWPVPFSHCRLYVMSWEEPGVVQTAVQTQPCLLQEQISRAPEGITHQIIRVFQIWRDRCDGSYQSLWEELDQYSVFSGRNLMVSCCICLWFVWWSHSCFV